MEKNVILMIEDNEDDITLILNTLSKSNVGNKIEVARDGAEALDMLFGTGKHEGSSSCKKVAVVLLDIKLPKIDGLEVLKRLRADERTKVLPVVLLTSSKEERDIINGYKLGCNSYVRKPVEFKEFSDAIRALGLYWLLVNEPPIK